MTKNLRPDVKDILANPFPLEALDDRVIIYADDVPKVTEAGIIIPDTAIAKPSRGTIVELGPQVKDLNRGDRVIYGRYAGTDVEWGHTFYLIVRKSDIMLRERSAQ